MTRGRNKIDFGAAPGSTDTSVFVPVPGIAADAIPHAWLYPMATDDHTVEDHIIAPIKVVAKPPVAGEGFYIFAFLDYSPAPGRVPYATGQWFVAWSL